ncbi:hypothetical protein SASPL_140102 [Salvia splendens]|uniref:non-specific serine/threonine protein kinase n=1 Tax=Salvia splendens TaxID=180675 RepID=A0A8X8WPM6_SALSN|nr:probable serine/threonine-protein kinase DDB_G0282963 [Salvia splendens]XP_042020606.1 probable serine/threonine-protein kinase DDB_G0282963 [Salvia splendens]XP_042020607.1 probable serine/threonine-protein kinase DDB_G0282963 [Salvia splendens]KAG6398635.1 hypothetical protein SASPL_140102 [Salvia splendens]
MESGTEQSAAAASSSAPPAEELLKKIHELELGHAHLKHEMSKLITTSTAEIMAADRRQKQRSHSISPQRVPRWRTAAGDGNVVTAWKKGSATFRHASPLQRESHSTDSWTAGGGRGGGGHGPAAVKLTDKQYLNILQSMGQSVHIFDLNFQIIYWNKSAEKLYGYSTTEALGQDAIELLTDPRDSAVASNIVRRVAAGESWTGQVPVKNKRGDRFLAVATNTPFYDDDDTLVGVICVSSDSRPFIEAQAVNSELGDSGTGSRFSRARTISGKFGLDHQQPLQVAIASKISNLATKVSNKVKSKMRPSENSDREGGSNDSHHSEHGFPEAMSEHREDAASSGASTPRGDIHPSPFGVFSGGHGENSPGKPSRDSGDEGEGKPGISKILSSKAEAWIAKKGLTWPWKGNEQDGAEPKSGQFGCSWENNQEHELGPQKSAADSLKPENHTAKTNHSANNEAPGYWSSFVNVNSTSSASSCGSTSSSALNKIDMETDCLDYEILWEDLTIGEQIGQGSCGTVYHALWYGSDVAVKVFSKQEYSDDMILAFRQEVSLMKRLRHPNILLFMGAVTSSQCLCIVTEFLPRGSLFRLLQRNSPKLERRRRIQMALDIARGMNYLHHCNPPIIHRDLKSSNLLVDKNWTVKVGDFGLSRLKHETYLTTRTGGKGTPQWMAPEVLRNEPSDEKSDVYSFGVILWELVTHKIPWDNLNSMQVIGAVGFMNQRLEIPSDVEPQWTSLIESCWHSEPQSRPSFQELMEKLKDMQRQCAIQMQAGRAAAAKER